MKRPTRVRVLGKIVRLAYFPAGDAALEVDGDRNNFGVSDPDHQAIVIQDGLPLGMEQDAVLHEVLHTVEAYMKLDVPEEIVEKFATGLLAVLKDNPTLVSYLRAREK